MKLEHLRTLSLLLVGQHWRPSRHFYSRLPTSAGSSRRQLRRQFQAAECRLEQHVRWEALTQAERDIHRTHGVAVQRGRFTYGDPQTGLRVLTRLRHFLRGSCCGNACRHCVYDHRAVPEHVRTRRRFNSAFWVDRQSPPEDAAQ